MSQVSQGCELQPDDVGRGALMLADLDRLRRKWRRYWEAQRARHAEWESLRDTLWQEWRNNPSATHWREPARLAHVPMPADLHGLICGARNRSGMPCKRRDLYLSGRCKLHGGLSTGPKTDDGKARSARNGKAASRTPCVRQDYGKAGRTPCDPLQSTNAGQRSEAHERETKLDLVDQSTNCRGSADGL
ncbi:MAG: hypothetical protein EBY30_08250 [Rhodospirillales bacterium]|nr:hypothetical protein [Rhodospirillales bacterium]